MVLDEPDGLSVGKLNKVQTRMMINTKIPNHLKLYLKEIDLRVTLEYAVTGKKMLSHLLKSERLSMNAFFGLLLQVAQGMEEGRLYMLDPVMYALHEDYIFIEGSLQNGKVYLAYIPWDNPAATHKPGESMRSLIMVLMASITELRGTGVQRLLQYCGEEGFSSGGLKALLAELLTEGGDSIKANPISTVERRATIAAVAVEEQTVPNRLVGWTGGYPSFQSMEEDHVINKSDSLNSESTNTSSSKIYIVLGCLLGGALLWKFLYLNHPNSLALLICGVISVVLAVISGLAWLGKLHLGGSSGEADEDEEAEIRRAMTGVKSGDGEQRFSRPSLSSSGPSAIPRHDPEPRIASRSGPSPANFLAEAPSQVAASIPMPIPPTALLSREKPTVKEQGKVQHQVPYLERYDDEGDGLRERIELNRPSFIIGRSTEVAQYIERSEGASRVHAEISRSTGGYILKDLDSRNGTFFQGESMIPYKEYQLAEGDVFTIVKGNYMFRTA
ncbi:DUF6382 domain-containing protein [Paenibacillus wynnii]|uniref:FHA domain-containing protein n=1 Tax=Paenibacillus wynnii TaxID=268407 RepID=A0A098M901_9BACL|nr:DUF6382 domain-containing protein [Paenibacillus wynnii]KGE19035.1 hypothetical protein PWYN_06480 [Paenibacillus wynnii]